MEKLRNKAKELLQQNTVQAIIGYENGTNGKARPCFITHAADTDRLIYDDRCMQNLAVYLVKNEVKKLGKIGVVASLPVMRSIMMLISEKQVQEENITVLGVSGSGELLDFNDVNGMEKYLQNIQIENPVKDKMTLEKLNAMSLQERWDFWQSELSKCFRCYACRAACPLCYCTRCTIECNQPQWIPVLSHPAGNLDWHLMRAMHLTGRCVSCGECGRACPLDIPVHLLTMHMADEAHKMFGVKTGISKDMPSALSTFKPDDKENFIQ